jgi:hypothetical protein
MRPQRIIAAFIVGLADLLPCSPRTERVKRRYLARRGLDLAQPCELMEDRAGCQVRRHKD